MPINSGDTAWVLASSALVLLMTPGLALFYGGMARSKSVLNMLMMSFSTIALVSVIWVAYGYSIAFTSDKFNGLLGGLDALGLRGGVFEGTTGVDDHKIPVLAFAAFQMMFAIITPALISGAIADRAKFGAWMLFVGVWVTIVYLPVAHWVFFFDGGNGGWIADKLVAFDFAGGTAVHINAGAAALALVFVLGKRVGWPRESMQAAQRADGAAGRRSALVRLVRLQRRLGGRGQRNSRRWPSSTPRSPRVRRFSAGSWWRSCATASPPSSVRRPVPSPVSSPSPRPVPRSSPWAASRSASSPASSAPWRSA